MHAVTTPICFSVLFVMGVNKVNIFSNSEFLNILMIYDDNFKINVGVTFVTCSYSSYTIVNQNKNDMLDVKHYQVLSSEAI